ncbi:hypothetical protein ACETRX_37180 [Labrys portucalensis]|uniref:Uncharacterized protein n=1 Tax=Labrys neptuniae TaxID=376174 RepID=A0ABV6ZSL9_9HYPH
MIILLDWNVGVPTACGATAAWLDRGELNDEEAEASVIVEYEARIAALERKVGQLTMELDFAKKTPRQPTAGDSERSSIITGPRAVLSDGGVK